MAIRIIGFNKADGHHENPFTAITTLDWVNDIDKTSGTATREQIYNWIKGGALVYVQDRYNNKSYLQTEVTPNGIVYVKTQNDNMATDKLLELAKR